MGSCLFADDFILPAELIHLSFDDFNEGKWAVKTEGNQHVDLISQGFSSNVSLGSFCFFQNIWLVRPFPAKKIFLQPKVKLFHGLFLPQRFCGCFSACNEGRPLWMTSNQPFLPVIWRGFSRDPTCIIPESLDPVNDW